MFAASFTHVTRPKLYTPLSIQSYITQRDFCTLGLEGPSRRRRLIRCWARSSSSCWTFIWQRQCKHPVVSNKRRLSLTIFMEFYVVIRLRFHSTISMGVRMYTGRGRLVCNVSTITRKTPIARCGTQRWPKSGFLSLFFLFHIRKRNNSTFFSIRKEIPHWVWP